MLLLLLILYLPQNAMLFTQPNLPLCSSSAYSFMSKPLFSCCILSSSSVSYFSYSSSAWMNDDVHTANHHNHRHTTKLSLYNSFYSYMNVDMFIYSMRYVIASEWWCIKNRDIRNSRQSIFNYNWKHHKTYRKKLFALCRGTEKRSGWIS